MSVLTEKDAMAHQLAAEQLRAQRLEKEMARMRELGSARGFFNAFFAAINANGTREKAFDAINEEYFELFGEYRYNDYNSFRSSRISRQNKK